MSERRRRSTATPARHHSTPWLLVAAMVLIALGCLYVVLTGGGATAFAQGGDADDTDVLAASDDDPGEDVVDDADVALTSVTHDIYLSRDPFDPVVPEPAATAASDAGSTSDDSATGDQGDTSDDQSNGDTSGVCTGTSEVVCEGRVVSLLGITRVDGEQRAVVQVDVNIYEVAEGQVFAEVFQLRTIDDPCVSLLYGDEAFSLCTGDRLLK